jgi:hypothetical protein
MHGVCVKKRNGIWSSTYVIFRRYHYTSTQNFAELNSSFEVIGLDSRKPTSCVTPIEWTTLPNGTTTHDSTKLIICHYFTVEPHVQWITWQCSCRIYKETRLIDFNRIPVCHAYSNDKGSETWAAWLTRSWEQCEKGTKYNTAVNKSKHMSVYDGVKSLGRSVEKSVHVCFDVIRRQVFANYSRIRKNKIKFRINHSFCVTRERVLYFLHVA